jgi:hypothetical protein
LRFLNLIDKYRYSTYSIPVPSVVDP